MSKPVYSGIGPPGALKLCLLSDEVYHPWDPSPFLHEYTWDLYLLNRLNSVHTVQELVKGDYDIFFNFCDASWDEPYPGPEVVRALEEAGVAFTGGTSEFYDPSREAMKRACRRWELHTPTGIEAYTPADIERAAASLAFPLMVKAVNSYGSVGIERESRVENLAALQAQASRVIAEFGGALIEEFIEGREFTVLVAENPDNVTHPVAFQPVEWLFPPGETFKHYHLKWDRCDEMKVVPVTDPGLAEALKEAGRKLFLGLNGASFGRCDVRMDAAGHLYMLEINPNCSVLEPPDAPGGPDFILVNDPEGHRGFLDLIFRAALARRQRTQPKWLPHYHPQRGDGVFARANIAPGEIILPFEKRPHNLVCLSQVLENWPPEQQRLFERHAYPLSDEIWVAPFEDPASWAPLRHACDPNAWWQGLNIVARREIAAGEEVTLDYATFHNERMPEFTCACESPDCRHTIRGSDFLQPFVARYGDHVTEYVRMRRCQRQNS